MKELPKSYEPQKYEDGIYKRWEDSGYFHPEKMAEDGLLADDAPNFSMVLPPPNVTGTLHMGHAAMLAIEDLMARYHRMKGDKTLWIPGTDHAAIATQTKVEKLLMAKEGIKDPRAELGREKFLERVREYAQESHDTIINQCKKMGASLDWKMEAYTLDEARSLAVRTVFKKMYDDGLIYRGYRLVNWCPRCQSTLADDEVEHKEQTAKLYTFKYSADFPFAIATTRPETKLGDTAVAVNPKDKRYKKFIGKTFEIKNFASGAGTDVSPSLRGRGRGGVSGGVNLSIKIIADESVAMDFGTGALGVTPAHSQVDYEMAQKNNLPVIKVIDENGKMTTEAGAAYVGLDVLKAREKVVENLRAAGLLEKEEDTPNSLSICYRCGAAIEPLPSKQWFMAVNKEFKFHQSKDNPIKSLKDGQKATLKKLMQQVVKNGQIEIIPDRFNKTYFHWIDNLRDWCISRQIWFGHRIPVWYKKISNIKYQKSKIQIKNQNDGDQDIYVGINAPEGEGWVQDTDTLDTWFSSGLWTFSTLGWPGNPPSEGGALHKSPLEGGEGGVSTNLYLKYNHPTSILETGYDIIFFWVARMILMTTYTLGEIPFHKIYLHGLVRDEKGRKMSKSLDNVIDPLDMIKKYGADATRLSLLLGNTPGNDMKLSEEKVEGFRNFANKLWNISRFIISAIASGAPRPPLAGKQSHGSVVSGPSEENGIATSLPSVAPRNDKLTLADRWILSKLNNIIETTTENIEKYNFSCAGEQLRDFTWGDLADWYLEIAKIEGGRVYSPARGGEKEGEGVKSKSQILNYILNTVLKLWHPFMPFVTETIWQEIYGDKMLMVESWPSVIARRPKADAAIPSPFVIPAKARIQSRCHCERSEAIPWKTVAADFDLIKSIITGIRSLRADHKIEPAKKLNCVINAGKKQKLLQANAEIIKGLARLNQLQINSVSFPRKRESRHQLSSQRKLGSCRRTKIPAFAGMTMSNSIGFVESGVEVFIDLTGVIDAGKEKQRLEAEIGALKAYTEGLGRKLANRDFLKNAPPAVVEKEQKKLAEAKEKLEKLSQQLQSLK